MDMYEIEFVWKTENGYRSLSADYPYTKEELFEYMPDWLVRYDGVNITKI